MTRFLVTGDWHLGLTTHGVTDMETGINSRHTDALESVQEILTIAAENGCDYIIHTGDIFHTCKPGVQETLTFYKFMIGALQAGIPVHAIIGNHDFSTQFGKPHALAMFQKVFPNIYNQVEWVDIDGLTVCFAPFGAAQPAFDQRSPDIIVCHSHLEGAVVGAEPYEIKDDKITRFKDLPARAVFAGHFHKPQGLCQDPLAFYPGSLQAVDFNERLDQKGVAIVDMDQSTCSLQFVPLTTARRLVQYDVETPSVPPGAFDGVKDAIVKVNVTLSESEAHEFDEGVIRESLMNSGAHSVASINLIVDREHSVRDSEIKIDAGLASNLGRYLDLRDIGHLRPKVEAKGKAIIHDTSSV